MWEKKREDGSRRLKSDAVPTKFFSKEVLKNKTPIKRNKKSPFFNNIPEPDLLEVKNPSNNINIKNLIQINHPNQIIANYEIFLKKMIGYEQHFKKSATEITLLKNCIRFMDKRLKTLENNDTILHSIFKTDQIEASKKKSTASVKWSRSTIMKALRLKFSCGNNGYEELIKQNIPLPCLRTLRRILLNINFEPGILHEVFKFLEIKIQTFKNDDEKDCVLIMDETPANLFVMSSNTKIGNSTLPNHKRTGINVLVFMLGGISTRWKQIIAYYFTEKTIEGNVYHDIIVDIITKVKNIGLNIVALKSNMGLSNQSLWRKWNITARRHCTVSNYLPHPLDDARKLFVIPDVPHTFKNIKNMFKINKILYISNEVQTFYNLPTNRICIYHIDEIIKYQEELDFVLVPKQSERDLMPNHFQKLEAEKSTNAFNYDICTALQFLSKELNKPHYLTTAWFIEIIDKWFSLMTSKHPVLALSKLKPDIYEESIQFLKQFIIIMTDIKVGHERTWKLSQARSLLATTSILDIQKIFLVDKEFHFILTSRFTEDCLENVFSELRTWNIVPNGLLVKNNLKLLYVSQYLRDVSKEIDEEDDGTFLTEVFDTLNTELIED